MDHDLTISEAANKVGLSAKTIRFYESAGVITPLSRQENSYRRFSQRDIQRLLLIKRARNLGLPLSEIKNIVSECIDKGCLEARQPYGAVQKRVSQITAKTYMSSRLLTPEYVANIIVRAVGARRPQNALQDWLASACNAAHVQAYGRPDTRSDMAEGYCAKITYLSEHL